MKHNSFLDRRSSSDTASVISEYITYQRLTTSDGRGVRLSESCYQSSGIPTVSYLILYLIRLTKVGEQNHRDKTSHETTAMGGEDQRHALIMGNVNRVLDHRVCIPISLSMVYALLANPTTPHPATLWHRYAGAFPGQVGIRSVLDNRYTNATSLGKRESYVCNCSRIARASLKSGVVTRSLN